jgi:WD40 repeat protein
LSADGHLAVSTSRDKTLKVWNLENGTALRTLESHANDVAAMALSADGRWVVSTFGDHTLKVWNLESGAALASFSTDGAVDYCAIELVGDHANALTIVAGDRAGRMHFLRLEGLSQL